MADTTRRKFFALTGMAIAGVAAAGCSASGMPWSRREEVALDRAVEGSRTLVAYFSLPLTDDPNGMNEDEANSAHVVDGQVLGNTQYVAQLIQARLGADLFRIETAEPLPLDIGVLEQQALREQEAGDRPALKASIPDLADYDTIFIGYPIYWYDMPMPVYTFLEQHDFSGKAIIPFTTHGGSRLSGTVEIIADKLPNSTVVSDAFTISRDDMDDAPGEVRRWLDGMV